MALWLRCGEKKNAGDVRQLEAIAGSAHQTHFPTERESKNRTLIIPIAASATDLPVTPLINPIHRRPSERSADAREKILQAIRGIKQGARRLVNLWFANSVLDVAADTT